MVNMKLSIIFPSTEIGTDPGAIREWAQGAEGLGYHQMQLFEHVLGANPASYPGLRGYDINTPFREPFVFLGFMAAITRRIQLATGILVLPQRQTALVAKQAAEVDLLTGGRLVLGVGVGSNPFEYEALGENFHNRGARIEEQVAVLRALWTKEAVTFEGKWHHIKDLGMRPLPVQRPIPIWMGGGQDDRVLRRIGRMADGWIPGAAPAEQSQPQLKIIRDARREAGRDPATIALAPRVMAPKQSGPEQWHAFAEGWRREGAQYMVLNTMRCGFTKVEQHLELGRQFRDALKGLVTA